MNDIEMSIIQSRIKKLENYKKDLEFERKHTIKALIKGGVVILSGAVVSMMVYTLFAPITSTWAIISLLGINSIAMMTASRWDYDSLIDITKEQKKVGKKLEKLKSDKYEVKHKSVKLMDNSKTEMINELARKKRIIINNSGYIDPIKRDKVYGKRIR